MSHVASNVAPVIAQEALIVVALAIAPATEIVTATSFIIPQVVPLYTTTASLVTAQPVPIISCLSAPASLVNRGSLGVAVLTQNCQLHITSASAAACSFRKITQALSKLLPSRLMSPVMGTRPSARKSHAPHHIAEPSAARATNQKTQGVDELSTTVTILSALSGSMIVVLFVSPISIFNYKSLQSDASMTIQNTQGVSVLSTTVTTLSASSGSTIVTLTVSAIF